MSKISFSKIDQAKPEELIAVLNEDSLREHLIAHPYFDLANLQAWVESKAQLDELPGCRIRTVYMGESLAGWCGIQPDPRGFELAVVISERFRGLGLPLFKTLMNWAVEFGHKEVLFHLLDSRPEYKSLAKRASSVEKTEINGRYFTTYFISVCGH